MKKTILTTLALSALSMSSQAAVSLSQTNQGDLVILPYYTVKNNMNTTLTVNNHSDSQGKLVMISYKESKNNHFVLSYNVFIKPNSSFAVGLGAINSQIFDHIGEPSAVQLYNSEQCAPFLTPMQEFLPYGYEEAESTNLSLERAQEGYVEIYELGSFDPNNTALSDCSEIEESININEGFLNAHLSPATGEISATASLLNVEEGTSYSYNGTTFNDFSATADLSFDPFAYDPLDYNNFTIVNSTALIKNGDTFVSTEWENGRQAIEALLMSQSITADFSIETGINAQTEFVLSMPAKATTAAGECTTAVVLSHDREGNVIHDGETDMCHATQVLKLEKSNPSELSDVLMSQHQQSITPSGDTGRVKLSFEQSMTSQNGYTVTGAPVMGFAIQRYTNANAAPGLMAQYGSLFQFSSTKMASDQ